MKTLFQYIAELITLCLAGIGIAILGALIIALSPIIGIFLIANDD